MFFCGFFAAQKTEKAQALTADTIDSATKIGNGDSSWDEKDDLWNADYEYFDYKVLNDLKTKLFGSTTADAAAYIKNTANGAITDTGSTLIPASALNAKAGSNYGYVVKLGGLDWIVTSLTLDDSENPILTLYLADDLTDASNNVVTSQYYSDSSNNKGNNMYSRSILRKNIKSETGAYAKLALFDKKDKTKNASFEAQFLVQPKNIAYQRQQTAKGRAGTPYDGNAPNDALETPTNGAWVVGISYSPDDHYPDQDGNTVYYNAWGEDYIWIPSGTEAGYSNYFTNNTTSIWKLSTEQLSHTQNCSWFRSGVYDATGYDFSYVVASDGVYNKYNVSSTYGVRPALHLNLNSAALNAALPEPTDTQLTYTGEEPDFTLSESAKSWYKANVLGNDTLCKISYKNKETDEALTSAPTTVGIYLVTFTLQGDDYNWAGTSTGKSRSMTLEIVPKKLSVVFELSKGIPVLSLAEGAEEEIAAGDSVECVIRYFDKDEGEEGRKEYKLDELLGKTKYYAMAAFDNENYIPDVEGLLEFTNPSTPVNVKWVKGEGAKTYTGNKVSFDLEFNSELVKPSLDQAMLDAGAEYNNYDQFKATNVGTYTVTLTLLDKQNYVWGAEMGKKYAGKTDDATIEFKITEKELVFEVLSIKPSDWIVELGKSAEVSLYLPALVHAGQLTVGVYARRSATSEPLKVCELDLCNETQEAQCYFDTKYIEAANTYELIIKAENPEDINGKNYTFRFDKDYTLTVTDPVSTSGILWRLYEDGSPAGSMRDGASTTSATWDTPITYNGNAFHFTVNASGLGYTVDESFGTKGYETIKKGSPEKLASVTNAGTYVTTVQLKDGLGATHKYTIEWTIDKAKFDLSNVRWADDGKIPFNEKISMKAELVKDSIPAGLTPKYGGTRTASAVGDNGTASVEFTVRDTNNYVVPKEGDAASYIFLADGDLKDFEWTKKWEVVAREIPVSWSIGTIELDSGKKINAEALSGGFEEYVEYEYYETDSNGEILDAEAEPLKEPAITENKIRYYIAKAKIKQNYADAGSYVFSPEVTEDDLLSPVFEVGNALTAVKIAAKKTTYTYWGSPVELQFEVTQGSVATDAFNVVYYRGMIRMLGAPTDPDSYRAQISLKTGYTDRFYLDGVSSFDFKIERGTIEIAWNENVKPPVLNLTENQAKYVTYEYRNADGNTVGISALRTPGTYGVNARIKDTSKYIFDNTKAVTDWIEFTVRSGDTINDPTSSLPPFKPSTDPNDPNGGTNPSTGKTQVGIKTSNTTVYFNGNSQAAQFDNTAGLPESAFIVTYNGQTTPPTTAGAYQVVISLRPEFADRYELTGNTSFLYTIVGANGEDGDNTGTLNGGATGGNASDATFVSYLPVILSGVSLVLIVVFCVMTLNYNSAANAAKAKAKRLAQVTYSFAPLMAVVLGLAETNWWIVAGVLMGVALVMGIVAFLFKNKKQKALALLEEEEARIADEKAYAEKEEAREEQARRDNEIREEQARRDNEMRMMFAALQQNSQQSLNYEAIQGMISSTVSALLPAMQQQMALPPAQNDASPEAAPSAAQEEIERLHAQMAQQQEMLNQILQYQQQAQESYAVYEEEPVDDISWLGDGEELVSLEESYGNLTDEGKRCYYEIGSYIMNKPRTSQNDGKYAVLFKYRGRTVFKLAIKDDAPVLYYPADDGGRGEIRIVGATLELAKSFIDRVVIAFDN